MTNRSSRSGAVLLLVLCVLVLLSVIAVAFLLSSSDHYLLATGYTRTTEARLLSDSACQLAIGQIQNATGVTTASNANPPLWFSQPGMIRDIDPASGQYTAYKLYSAPTMVVGPLAAPSAFNPVTLSGGDLPDVPQAWANDPSDYVDLNQPVAVNSNILSSQLLYPIVDPSVNTSAGPTSPTTAVQGFWYKNANSTSNADNVTPFQTGTTNVLPMPVRWLYVLQDGTIEALGAGGVAAGANSNNPIVGRIAFWTDDETCKININTACGDEWTETPDWGSGVNGPNPLASASPAPPAIPGVPIPGSYASQAYNMSAYDFSCLYTPAVMNHEFTRYPGHPASTYLSAVFPTLNRQQLAQLAPRVAQWTTTSQTSSANVASDGGTINTLNAGGALGGQAQVINPNPLTTASTRLYDSIDELQYAPVTASINPNGTNAPRFDLSTVSSSSTTTLQPLLTPATIQPLRFFLTANSVAPELNVFGRPRVSMWPLSAKVSIWTAFDKLAAFCSGLGASTSRTQFAFFRYYSNSPTTDASLKPTTGYSYNNSDLFNYLSSMMSNKVPGHANSLATKFGADSNQILTEILDYIRCTNLEDPNVATASSAFAHGSVSPISLTGNVCPLQETSGGTTYQGFGREPILNRVTFIFWIMNPTGSAPNTTYSLQCMILPEFFSPMLGQAPYQPSKWTVSMQNLSNLTLTGTNSGSSTISGSNFFPSSALLSNSFGNSVAASSGIWGSYGAMGETLGGTSIYAQLINAQNNGSNGYQFLSNVIPLSNINSQWNADVAAAGTAPQNDGLILSSTGPITITFNDVDTNYTQNYTINLNGVQVEARIPGDVPGQEAGQTSHLLKYAHLGDNIFHSDGSSSAYGVSDSAMSVEVSDPNVANTDRTTHTVDGDYRFISLIPTTTGVATKYFQPHYLAMPATVTSLGLKNEAASFPDGSKEDGSPWIADPPSVLPQMWGSFIEYSNNPGNNNFPLQYTTHFGYNQNNWPDFPTSLNSKDNSGTGGALLIYNGHTYKGDWDSGIGHYSDGPYVNKPDEGGTFFPFGSFVYNGVSVANFSPNREIPSPVMLGSLPTGFQRGQPWQTLLFCPNPASRTTVTDNVSTGNDTSHPGFADPADHLILDLFDMPVVEPYAISQPFATAGKVNLNYQMVPFTYIHRDTALRAVLRSTMVTAVPTQAANIYKFDSQLPPSFAVSDLQTHYPVDLDTTLGVFDARFKNNLPFQTASEICTMFLFPLGLGFSPSDTTAPSDLQNWWVKGTYGATYNSSTGYNMALGDNSMPSNSVNSGNSPTSGFALTGDNLREQPYSQIYSRLTTQSNSYTVHVWAQTLKQVPSSTAGTWNNANDLVTGEYRGSYLVERYLNPNIASYNIASPPSLNSQYKMRIVSSRVFAP